MSKTFNLNLIMEFYSFDIGHIVKAEVEWIEQIWKLVYLKM